MKYLGLDYGTKRIGISVSDETGEIAFPLSVLENDDSIYEKIQEIVKKEKITSLVLGESRNLTGAPNPVMKKIDKFAAALKFVTKLPLSFEPEFMTTAEAESISNQNTKKNKNLAARKTSDKKIKNLDAKAAAIILQSYLNKKRMV